MLRDCADPKQHPVGAGGWGNPPLTIYTDARKGKDPPKASARTRAKTKARTKAKTKGVGANVSEVQVLAEMPP